MHSSSNVGVEALSYQSSGSHISSTSVRLPSAPQVEGQAGSSVPETCCAVASHPGCSLGTRLIQLLLQRFSVTVDHLRGFRMRFCLDRGWLNGACGSLLPALLQLLLCYPHYKCGISVLCGPF